MSRKTARLAALYTTELRLVELRDRVGQAQALAEATVTRWNSVSFAEIVRSTLIDKFVQESGLSKIKVSRIFQAVEKKVSQIMIQDDADETASINISGVIGPISINSSNVWQSQSIVIKGNRSSLVASLRELGFSTTDAQAQAEELDRLSRGAPEIKARSARSLAGRIVKKSAEIVERLGLSVAAPVLTKIYLQYLGLDQGSDQPQ